MKLHYSQTLGIDYWGGLNVSVPYEITLLSNLLWKRASKSSVSVPYEITLLSNYFLPLFCNTYFFSTLLNYTTLKHHFIHFTLVWVSVPYEITLLSNRWLVVSINIQVSVPYEITLLSNGSSSRHTCYRFQYLMKLHYSQTVRGHYRQYKRFQYLMKLHYSQTVL